MKKLDRIKCKAIVSDGPEKGKEVVGHYSRSYDSKLHYITELDYHLIPHDPDHHPQPRKGTRSHHVDGDTVRQWTGLKDKHGQEIYEGDRLRYFYMGDSEEGTVEWIKEAACFEVVVKTPEMEARVNFRYGVKPNKCQIVQGDEQ